jgi:hypothetical protein
MDFSNNPHLKDYLRKKEIEEAAKKASRKRIVEEQNKKKWLEYQQDLRNTFGLGYAHSSLSYVENDLLLYYDASIFASYSGSGSTINDLSKNNRNGTIVGSPLWNSAGYFTFSNDYIITPDLDQVITIGDEAHSVEVWINPTNNGVIASHLGQSAVDDGYHNSIIELVSGQVEFGLWTGAGITSTGGTGALSFNEWHQLVLTYGGHGTPVKGYIDGVLVGQTANLNFSSPMDNLTSEFRIAFGALDSTSQGDGTYFDGRFGIARVYGRALTDAEIVQNYRRNTGYYR